MILDENTWVLRGFSKLALPRLAQGSKKNDEGIIYNISNKEKKSKMFNSKILLRSDHKVCSNLATFSGPVFSWVSIDLYRGSHS